MLQLERTFELLGLDDGVDPEFAGVAMVGPLEGSLAALEETAGTAVRRSPARA